VTPDRTETPSDAGKVVTVDLEGRPFALYVPEGYRPATPTALIVALHGYTGRASDVMDYFGLRAQAAKRNILVATPEGTTDSEGNTFWNASKACCNLLGSTVDDSAYLSSVITTVLASYAVDPDRVYVVGHSNGGFMAHRMACEHADQVAAVASLAGALDSSNDCDPAEAVSVLQIHGDADQIIPFTGGAILGNVFTSAAQTVAFWQDANGCSAHTTTGTRFDADQNVVGDDVTPIEWSGCRDETGVALWRITGGSHVPALTGDFAGALVDWLEAHRRG